MGHPWRRVTVLTDDGPRRELKRSPRGHYHQTHSAQLSRVTTTIDWK